MVRSAKFPRVAEKNGDYFARLKSSSKASRKSLHPFAIFGKAHALWRVAGVIDDGDLFSKAPAGLENQVMNEEAVGITIELSARSRNNRARIAGHEPGILT
jgi:hypothetical protein